MANEVQITVTSRDKSGPGFDSAGKRIKGVEKAADSAGRRMHVFGTIGVGAAGKLRAGLGLAGAGVAGLAAGALGLAAAAGPRLLDMGVRIEAMGNKARTVFGGSLPLVSRWADTASAKMGLTSKEAQGLAAGIGDLLTPMGFAQKQAATMSTKVADLAGAFSQWSNGTRSAADASDALTGALTGEFDSLKAYGVQLDADTVKVLLHKAGKDKLTGSALKQAEAEVILAEITRQSGNAIAGYTQGNNKLALAKAKLSSIVGTLKEKFVGALIPAMTTAATWLGDKLPKAADKVGKWFTDNKKTLAEWGLNLVVVTLKGGAAFMRLVQYVALAAKGILLGLKAIYNGVFSLVIGILTMFGKLPGKMGAPFRAAAQAVREFKEKNDRSLSDAIAKVDSFATRAGRAADALDTMAARVQNLRNKFRQLPANKVVTLSVKDQATSRIRSIQRRVDSLTGKTYAIRIVTTGGAIMGDPSVRLGGSGHAHGGITGAAAGGIRGNLVRLGERGDEFVRLPVGSRVYPHGSAPSGAAGAGWGPPQVVLEVRPGGSGLDRLFVEWLRAAVQVRGGNVQTVLGR